MKSRKITDKVEPMDDKTSRLVRDAVGERLEHDLPPKSSNLSPRLQHLMDDLRKRDSEGRR
ncbi:MAG: hypothetical protein QOG73_2076 [Acetobacteraceae bacterium]|jgi:hypothetical protein|nr:hypothetical protein [Acetobacteraceae bacterium]